MMPSLLQIAEVIRPEASKGWVFLNVIKLVKFAGVIAGLVVGSEKVNSILSPASRASVPPVFLNSIFVILGPTVSPGTAGGVTGAGTEAEMLAVVIAELLGEFAEATTAFSTSVTIIVSAGAVLLQLLLVARATKNEETGYTAVVPVVTVVLEPTFTVV